MSKKIVQTISTTQYSILRGLSEKCATIDEFVQYLRLPKQNISYWMGKLVKEGFAIKVMHGIYDITWGGKNLLNTYDLEKSKEMIRLENMRYKFPIHEGLEKLVQAPWLKVNEGMRHIKNYHGRFEGFTVTVHVGSENSSLEITCPKRFGVDIYEMMYTAKMEVEVIANGIAEEYALKLGIGEPSMKPEWAIPSPIAEVILSKTYSSQIRTSKGVINRSRGRNADLETRDIHLAHKIWMMPDEIDEMRRELSELKTIVLKAESEKLTCVPRA